MTPTHPFLQADLWKPTVVVFDGEDGIDDGGLSVEMHAAFWKGVTADELKLFECAERTHSRGEPVFLPRVGACTHSLEMVGLMLSKSLINSHPTGPGLCRFVFDFLLEAEGKPSRAFAKASAPIMEQAETAINSLSHFDVEKASMFQGYLREQETGELRTSESIAKFLPGMTISGISGIVELPEGHELYDEPVTVDNLPRAVVASSKWLLRGSRLPQLEALRRGFTRHVRSSRWTMRCLSPLLAATTTHLSSPEPISSARARDVRRAAFPRWTLPRSCGCCPRPT
jgi:hypothetical protein